MVTAIVMVDESRHPELVVDNEIVQRHRSDLGGYTLVNQFPPVDTAAYIEVGGDCGIPRVTQQEQVHIVAFYLDVPCAREEDG